MTPQRRKEVAAGALVLLAIFSVYYFEFMPSTQGGADAVRTEVKFTPISVDNPSLRLDKLKKIHSVEYSGRHRNIFQRRHHRGQRISQQRHQRNITAQTSHRRLRRSQWI